MDDSHQPRVTGPADAATVVDVLVGAFYDDPVWSWAFSDPARRRDQHRELWGLFVAGAQRYPNTWLAAENVATSVWIPPDGTEFSEAQEAELEPLLVRLLGDDAGRVLKLIEAFDTAHPHDTPHYYLSLLGTDPARRGHGHGLALLAENLRRIDDEGLPAYLESTNPVNVRLYERHGFAVIGSFDVEHGPTVTTMWRAPRRDR